MGATDFLWDLIAQTELQVVHRTDAAFANLSGMKLCRNSRTALRLEIQRAWQIFPARQQFGSLFRIVDLDEQRASEFTPVTEKLIVCVHLVTDFRLTRDALGTDHFLDLIKHRVVILEKKCQIVANMNA